MKKVQRDIYTVFDRILLRNSKEQLLKQHAKVFWMSGLSGAGKSTLASGLEKELFNRGYLTQIIDGDNVRSGLNQNLGFSAEDREENLRRVAELSKLFLNCGVITINSFISPTRASRHKAREIIGKEDFVEVYVNAPLEVCEERDTKGLYKKARKGLIKFFTGIDSPFEAPVNPDIVINTSEMSIEESVQKLVDFVLPLIAYNNS